MPGSASSHPQLGEAPREARDPSQQVPQQQQRKLKYPRVDPPEVEDQPGQAIREDTPGYIPKAFPKLFPYGTGDYHGDHKGRARIMYLATRIAYVLDAPVN